MYENKIILALKLQQKKSKNQIKNMRYSNASKQREDFLPRGRKVCFEFSFRLEV